MNNGNQTVETRAVDDVVGCSVETRVVDGVVVDIVGCWDNQTPENEYDFYDLFVDGECINLGEPCYEKPTDDDIRAFLELQKELQKD